MYRKSSEPEAKVETGRVSEGSKSKTKFTLVDMEFEFYPCNTVEYQLLPTSRKPIEVEDLVKAYCTECGAKVKSKFKFCPVCGEKQ